MAVEKSSRNKIFLFVLLLTLLITIILSGIWFYNVKLSINRYTYNTEAEFMNDLKGTWVSYFPETGIKGSSYYTFNDDYTMVQADYDDNGNIEYSNTYVFELNPQKGIIYVKDKECDLYNYNGEQYFRQYITIKPPQCCGKELNKEARKSEKTSTRYFRNYYILLFCHVGNSNCR